MIKLLNDDERIFIKSILFFVNDKRISGIQIQYYSNYKMLQIEFKKDYYDTLFTFNIDCEEQNKKIFFKNLRLNWYYTLEELGVSR